MSCAARTISIASRPVSESYADLSFALDVVPAVPPPPPGQPQFRQTDLIEYYIDGDSVTAHFPRYGQLRLDLANGITDGRIISAALDTYGVFEDLVAIGLSPHLRRRGMYLMHAFAAAAPAPTLPRQENTDRGGRGVLIVGDIGSGKTTTGMALLSAGWKLLSNDSPIISATNEILSYPGLLAAYPNTFARFESTQHLAANADADNKLTVPAESIWPEVWLDRATPGAILFPQIEQRTEHALEPLSQPEALRMLLPHAIEQWDKDMIPAHLALLNELAQSAPAFRLRLGPDTSTLPTVISSTLDEARKTKDE
ncbi:MAG: hypothetical protein AABZ58_16040 [Chloroflexota bacterium]